jgi:serine phosphatase RsbU (regulator of sigma subunit)
MKIAERNRSISILAFVIVLALTMTIVCLYFYNIVKWGAYPDFGFGWRTATGIEVVGLVTENGRRAGLQVGDRIKEVNSGQFADAGEFRALMRRKLGDTNTYLIERKGREFAVTIQNVPIGFKRSFIKSGFLFVLGLCYVFIGGLVFLMKPHRRISWIYYFSSSVFGLWFIFLYKASKMTPLWLETVHIFAYTYLPAILIHLAFSFPEERNLLRKHPQTQFIPYIISALLFICIRSTAPTMYDLPKAWLFVAVAYLAGGVIVFLGSCLQLWLTSLSEIAKLRSKLILLGLAMTGIVPLIDFISSSLFEIYILPNFNFYLPFFVFFPLAIAYSIVKHDLFDIDSIIKRAYGYLLTTGALAGVYGLFVLVANLAFGRYEITKSFWFPMVFILTVVFLLNPIRNRVQRFIDRVFYRLEYDYQDTVEKISETMRSLLNLEDIGKHIMQFALEPMFVDAGSVMVLNREKTSYDCLIQSGESEQKNESYVAEREVPPDVERARSEAECSTLALDEPFIKKMADRKKTTTIYDIWEDPFFDSDRYACVKTFDRLGATLVVPLIFEDQLTGILSIGRKKSGKFYRREDINLLNTLANQGAVAIENARMVDEVVEKERLEEELSIAHDLQVSMLPSDAPQLAGFEIAAYSLAARQVGGDFYDFIDMGENKAGMIIGDVTGKSVSGALVMSASRSVFRMLSEEILNVSESMARANRRIKQDVKTGMFVALLYAVLNAEDKTLTLCSAGQTQPIYLPAKTGEAALVETRGDTFPLGILDDADYKETNLQLESGDKVVLYTDGIVEAMNEKEKMFGFDRLLELVQGSQAPDAERLLKEILSTVNEFVGTAEQHDDLTAIVIQVS